MQSPALMIFVLGVSVVLFLELKRGAYQGVVDVLGPLPFSVRGLDLECADRLGPEDGDATNVCGTSGTQ